MNAWVLAQYIVSIMARAIEATPIIRGKDAKRIREAMRREEESPNPKRLAFLEECKEVYERLTTDEANTFSGEEHHKHICTSTHLIAVYKNEAGIDSY